MSKIILRQRELILTKNLLIEKPEYYSYDISNSKGSGKLNFKDGNC